MNSWEFGEARGIRNIGVTGEKFRARREDAPKRAQHSEYSRLRRESHRLSFAAVFAQPRSFRFSRSLQKLEIVFGAPRRIRVAAIS